MVKQLYITKPKRSSLMQIVLLFCVKVVCRWLLCVMRMDCSGNGLYDILIVGVNFISWVIDNMDITVFRLIRTFDLLVRLT